MTAMRLELRSSATAPYREPQRPPWRSGIGVAVGVSVAAAAAWRVGMPPVLVGSGCVILAITLWRSSTAFRRMRRRPEHPQPTDRYWLITDDEIHTSDAGTARTWRWPAVAQVDVLPDHYLLRPDRGAALDIPRDALTDTQETELRAFLEHRGLLQPRGRLTSNPHGSTPSSQ